VASVVSSLYANAIGGRALGLRVMPVNLKRVAVRVPWWGKILAKIILARLPINNYLWKRLSLFQLGHMEKPGYAFRVFKRHFDSARFTRQEAGFVGLELGPGDSLFSAMIARAYGASAYYLVDAGAFANADVKQYRAMADFLVAEGLPVPNAEDMTSPERVLAACHATYGTSGLASLHAIPDGSVDFAWSHTVLQHVRRAEFPETIRELRRTLRAGGISSHWVDLQDCLGGGLNNLRFRDSVWESPFMADSGFYTNRIRYSEMLALFKEAGFDTDVINVKRWDRLPTPRSKLWGPFRDLTDEELCVQGFHVILRPV
jgi:SAM-dependent methyltransferase